MTIYEHMTERCWFCEEQCRETSDSYMKEFWAKTADFAQSVIARMTVAQAEAEWEGNP